MATVTYKNQPGTAKDLKKEIPLDGVKSPYTITKVLWSNDTSDWIADRLIPPALHVCCGMSPLGDVRLDLYQDNVDIRGDAARLPFGGSSFATILIDPPYSGVFQWNHDMLSELPRVAAKRIIFQHWFLPANTKGQYKKVNAFVLSELAVWQPRTYFGRVNVISIFDHE